MKKPKGKVNSLDSLQVVCGISKVLLCFLLLTPHSSSYSSPPAICTVRIAALRCFVATWGDVFKPKNFMSENSTWSYENYMKLKPKQEEQTFSKVRRLSAVKVSMRWMSHESYDAACCTSFYPRTKVFLFEVPVKFPRKRAKKESVVAAGGFKVVMVSGKKILNLIKIIIKIYGNISKNIINNIVSIIKYRLKILQSKILSSAKRYKLLM